MAFIHYLFLGHFEHDGEGVRFSKSSSDGAYRPVVRRPLDPGEMKAVFREVRGTVGDDLAFPDDWGVWLDDGYVVCNKYTRDAETIQFVARLVEPARCDIYDVGAFGKIALADWLKVTRCYANPQGELSQTAEDT